jgi:trk system potassium uptake protein
MEDNNPSGSSYFHKPGDRKFRVPRTKPLRIILPHIPIIRPRTVSLMSFVFGFAVMIGIGAVLLNFPFSSKSGLWTAPVDCLFTATSAVCVTGLVVVDTLDHWSALGQLIILLLIQLGGLGFMTTTTILMLAAGRRIGLRDRILIGESIGVSRIGGLVRLTRNIFLFTLAAEFIGAVLFYIRFSSDYGWTGGIWKAVFQSVSAFNNAGFDLFGGFRSLTGYSGDYLVVLTTAALVILGGLGFLAIENIIRSRSIKRSSADTKIILAVTIPLLILGTLVVLLFEFNNPHTLADMPFQNKILNAFFQSITARTAGFNTLDTGALTLFSLFFVMILMFIGGASGSTAGGIKVNTLGIILSTIWSTLRGKETPGAFGREFPIQQIFRGMALLVISLGLIVGVFLLLSYTEHFASIRILFETISAFGTVGLSTGITPELSTAGRFILVVMMFIGRLGPLTLIMALARAQRTRGYRFPQESVRIG